MTDKLLTKKIEEAQKLEEAQNYGDAIKLYEEVLKTPIKGEDEVTEEATKAKETAAYRLGGIYKEKGLVAELV